MNFIHLIRFPKSKLGVKLQFGIPVLKYAWLVFMTMIPLLLTGCAGSGSETGRLEVRVWDHREAIDDFDELRLTFSAVGIHPANQPRTAGWIELTPSIQELDLTQYVTGQQAEIGQATVQAGAYNAVRLSVDRVEGVLKGGQPVEVDVRFDAVALDFQIRSGQITVLGLDLMVLDLSDHPNQGYELHLREAIVLRNR